MLAAEPAMYGPNGNQANHEPIVTQEWERTFALFTHLSLAAVMVIPVPVVLALVMWLMKRDQSAFVDDHGKEAVNFQISLVIYGVVGAALVPMCGVGIVVATAAAVLGIVGAILGALAASKGQLYRYPACIRFVH